MTLAVSLGDPAGVGPEIALRAFAAGRMPPALVYGDLAVLERCRRELGLDVPLRTADGPDDLADDALNVRDADCVDAADVRPGTADAACGAAALAYVRIAATNVRDGRLDALVTLPINKHAVRLAEGGFTGHTGYLAELCGATGETMMLASPRLLVAHASTHEPLAAALAGLNAGRIGRVIALAAETAARLGRQGPVGVLGVNPHAGEAGAFGDEEAAIVAPAVEAARAAGLDVRGPLPPDTAFGHALAEGWPALVAMFHDQGHIPMKLLDFERTVNVTLGLPIVRTSVDHGTAFDIAWRGTASIESFVHACGLAVDLSGRR